MRSLSRLARLLVVTLLAAGVAACGSPPGHQGATRVPTSQAALVKAAKKEGSFTFYSSLDPIVNDRLVKAFDEKYGIKGNYVHASVADSQVRFASEARAGNPGADLMFGAGFQSTFLSEGLSKGWLEPVSKWGTPLLKNGSFPKKAEADGYVMLESSPMIAIYNTKTFHGTLPKTWTDLTKPAYKGKLVLTNPNSSIVYVQFWARLIKEYGPSLLKQIAANGPITWKANMDSVNQAVAANEGQIGAPVVTSQILALSKKGAPVKGITLPNTTGTEMKLVLTATGKTQHPAAARLFADWAMSKTGARLLASNGEGVSIYDEKKLPPGYEAPTLDNIDAVKKQVTKLLGAPGAS